jgi:uncharacterized membrane protein
MPQQIPYAYQYHGFRWSAADGMQPMPNFPGATDSVANAVSANGQVIVGNSGPGPNCTMGYRWTAATGLVAIGSLPPNPPFESRVYGVSANGVVLVGQSDVCAATRAMRWTSVGGMEALTGGIGFGNSMNAASGDGSLIVGSGRWTAATGGEAIPGMQYGFSVSKDGSVIVGRDVPGGTWFAKVWTSACGTRDLRTLLLQAGFAELAGWQLNIAYDIADDNRTIVGIGKDPGGQERGFLARLPKKRDLDFDGLVNAQDVLVSIASWGLCEPGTCFYTDINCDGTVGIADLLAIIASWDA